ncbi:hypothetical protein NPX13_g4673 [Xylaria arbuscula]|uniref:Wings apart-like protein C-terminal domain-containing protein n=1 Tax=Xylaria arbuscula TaxID=114810 RepID=A0A9W8NF33_9PEZI|nr:hypothetical protein NPX13_g4673 [Xylaria arbuscula]
MATEFERGAQRQRRVTTYGKAVKKRRPKTVFTPVTASESMSDDDPLVAPDTAESRHPPPVPSPQLKRPPRALRESGQISCDASGDEEPPSAPEPRRSRVSQPGIVNNEAAHTQQNAPSEPTSGDGVGPRLSSPPPTPTPPRVSKPATKAPSHVLRRAPAIASSSKSASKQPMPQEHQIPLHLARDQNRKPKQTNVKMAREQSQHAAANTPQGSKPTRKPRKRLIDVLAEQESSDVDELDEDMSDAQMTASQNPLSQLSNITDVDSSSLLETPKSKTKTAPATGTRTFTRSSSALKFTYGQGRKVLEEEDDLLESLVLPSDSYSRRRLELGGPKKPTSAMDTFDFNDGDDETTNSPSSKLRGIHELRQAGANSRVADAMQDLVDQIGKPGANGPSLSSRRAALLQVVEKMRDKTFIREFRDHGVDSIMLKNIAKEGDIICSYLIVSALVMIFAKGSSAHLGSLLRTEQAGPVFARLLSISDDIKKVVKDRKTNLSKRNQNSITGVESLLRELNIWDGDQPLFVSPRNLAIKCLQLLIAQDVSIGGDQNIITDVVTRSLFQVLSDASRNSDYWNYPKTAQSIELCGALSVLDVHAVSMTATRGGDSEWALEHLSIIANAFHTSLQTPAHDRNTLEGLILKLTINVTNNNLAAPDIFASNGLLPALAASISRNFDEALALTAQNVWADGILDGLVLQLGILINFAEHSELVRRIVNECEYEERQPVKELIRLFIENHRRTGEADSMEKTHLNVAFGYLSILLGYLALHRPVREKLKTSHSAKSIGPLIGSIREFIAHYEQVENAISESQDGDRPHGSYVEGLQELVQQLEDQATRD